MSPYDFDPSNGNGYAPQAPRERRVAYGDPRAGWHDPREVAFGSGPDAGAQQRMAAEAWQRPREFSRANDHRQRGLFDNPYNHLEQAHAAVRQQGIEYAEPHYQRAIQAADRIDQQVLHQQRAANAQQMQELDRRIAEQRRNGRGIADLQRSREELAARERDMRELYLSPATSRANMGLAYIRTGQDLYVQKGEQLLAEARRLRPEIDSDPHFQRHLQDAYRQGQQRRDHYRWDGSDGYGPSGGGMYPPGDRRGPGQGRSQGEPGFGPGRPGDGTNPGGSGRDVPGRRPSGNGQPAGREAPAGRPGGNGQPGAGDRPGGNGQPGGDQGGNGRGSRYAPWVVPPGATSDTPVPPPPSQNGGDRPGNGSPPPGNPSDRAEKLEEPEPLKPKPIEPGKNYEPGAAETVGRGIAILAGLGLTLFTAKRAYGLVKRGIEWYRTRNEKAGGGTLETFENKDGTKLRFNVDSKGEVQSTTVGMKDGSELTIDKDGKVTRIKDVDGNVTDVRHGSEGKVRHEIRDNDGNLLKEKFFQDDQLRMKDSYGPGGKLKKSESFDASGRLTGEKNYDTMGKLADAITYDADGKIVKYRDGDGRDIPLKPEKKAELEKAAAERIAVDKAAAEKAAAQIAAAEKSIEGVKAEKAAAEKAAAEKAAGSRSSVEKPATNSQSVVEETSEFYDSQGERRGRDTTLKVEAKEAAGGLAILADKTIEPRLRETLEKHRTDKKFQELLEKKVAEAKDEKEREKARQELENYRKLGETDRARVREMAAEEAVASSKTPGRGRTVGRVVAIGGTVIAVGMLASWLLGESSSSKAPEGPTAKPTYGGK